ncbi:MAG: hypothetical protein ACRD20_02585 [Terriglobales bacterium]
MKCDEIREVMPDLAAGLTAVTSEAKVHLDSCAECAGKLEAFRQTMTLLDEWQAPEASPYFDVRLRARLREESAKQPAGWLHWLRRPVLAASFALVLVIGVSLVHMNSGERGNDTTASVVAAEPGTAVGDLQALEKNQALYSDFDVLDDLAVQPDVTANP